MKEHNIIWFIRVNVIRMSISLYRRLHSFRKSGKCWTLYSIHMKPLSVMSTSVASNRTAIKRWRNLTINPHLRPLIRTSRVKETKKVSNKAQDRRQSRAYDALERVFTAHNSCELVVGGRPIIITARSINKSSGLKCLRAFSCAPSLSSTYSVATTPTSIAISLSLSVCLWRKVGKFRCRFSSRWVTMFLPGEVSRTRPFI